jgi:hypothetical protein
MGEPSASKTARDVTFSEAMRRMDSRWRWISFSWWGISFADEIQRPYRAYHDVGDLGVGIHKGLLHELSQSVPVLR